MSKKQGLPPIGSSHPAVLILGSLPGDRSIAMQAYYAHPRNRFWQVMAQVLEQPLPDTFQGRKDMLTHAGIMLWDVYQAAVREGSLDTDIRQPEYNDLQALLQASTDIRLIATNGRKAAEALSRYAAALPGGLPGHIQIVALPSTSPANASWHLERLVEAWRAIRQTPHATDGIG